MRFQFLMVRLKVKNSYYDFFKFFISIPYGAIKRRKGKIGETDLTIFQFLMVRLKE